jgi:acetyltransferase
MRLAPVAPGQHPLDRLAILPYPQELERRIDGPLGRLTVRPIRPEDAPAHEAFFHALTPEDIRFRMFGPMRDLSPGQLARFTQIDYAREMAFIATRQRPDGMSETLGIVRVVSDPDNFAGEFAVTVRSDLKGQGLGTLLMNCLLDYCSARGLAEVTGVALDDNKRMLALAGATGFHLTSSTDGTVVMRCQLKSEPAA